MGFDWDNKTKGWGQGAFCRLAPGLTISIADGPPLRSKDSDEPCVRVSIFGHTLQKQFASINEAKEAAEIYARNALTAAHNKINT